MHDPTPHPARPRRVAIIDSDRRVRESLAALLDLSPELELVGTAGRLEDAYRLAALAAPDVVVVDPRLPDDRSGLDLIRHLRSALPSLRILVTGASSAGAGEAIASGADEFVPKGGGVEEFMCAVVRVASLPDRGAVLDGPGAQPVV